jgi:putative hydrolase of the HAD superfamily
VGSEPRRGLLVDWGGVLTTDLFASFRSFCETEGLQPDLLTRRFAEDPDARALLIGLETGRLTEQEFEAGLGELLEVSSEHLIDRLFLHVRSDEAMLDAVRRAHRQGCRTGLVSNSWGTRRYDRRLLEEIFDGIVISAEEGIRKPAPRIYALGAERIGLPPAQCVYVDDLPFNLRPAAELGMATVHHVASERTIPELEGLLGVSLTGHQPWHRATL